MANPGNIPTAGDQIGLPGTVPTIAAGSVTAFEHGDATTRRTILVLQDVVIATTDAASVGAYGSVKIYDFPEGRIRIDSSRCDLEVENTGVSNGMIATATYDIGLGTVAAALGADDDLATTEIDILGKQEGNLAANVADVEDADVIDAIWDGSATAKDCYLNVMIEQDDHGTAAGELTFNGEITIFWSHLGDD